MFHNDKNKGKEVERLSKTFVKVIGRNPRLKRYVMVFGVSGPAARGQASPRGSDVDFYCITNYLNPRSERYLRSEFDQVFGASDVDCGIMVVAPSVLKYPDLPLYEFTSSGRVIYGKLPRKVSIKEIPKWEGARLLCFKGDPFIAAIEKGNLEFYYSKMLLGIGEAFLVLEGNYVADNFKRYDRVLKSELVKSMPGFTEEYKKAHKFRYEGYNYKSKAQLKKKGLFFLQKAWRIFLTSYFDTDYKDALEQLQHVKPLTFKQMLGTRVFYTIQYWRFFKKIRFTLSEPFTREIFMLQEYLQEGKDEDLRKKIAESWLAAPRFWYSK
ncbi:hypothetical protein ACFL1B_02495 [Nanoarchaeota archaeon]